MKHKELPMLAGIAGLIRWCEELISLLSGPLLTIGLAIALIDLLSGGDLLRSIPALLFAWGVCQAVGIDSQLVSAWDRCRQAIRERRWLAVLGWVILGCVLGYVGFLSAEAFGFQHAFGLSEAQALTRLGIDASTWQLERAGLAVFLVALSGFTRYHPAAADVSADTEAERAKLEAELSLAPLREQVRMRQVRGVRGLAAAALGKAPAETPAILQSQFTQVEPEPAADHAPTERPPTGPGTPARKPGVRKPKKTGGKLRVLRNPSVEERAAAAWVPGMSIPALQKAAGISRPSAQKYSAKFTAQAAQLQNEQAAQ